MEEKKAPSLSFGEGRGFARGRVRICKRTPAPIRSYGHAWASREARLRLIEAVAGNLRAFLAGQPVNVVS